MDGWNEGNESKVLLEVLVDLKVYEHEKVVRAKTSYKLIRDIVVKRKTASFTLMRDHRCSCYSRYFGLAGHFPHSTSRSM